MSAATLDGWVLAFWFQSDHEGRAGEALIAPLIV